MSICKTKSNNDYLISGIPYYLYITPLVRFFIDTAHDKKKFNSSNLPKKIIIDKIEYQSPDIEYYYKKYLFIRNHGLLKEKDKPSSKKFTGYIDEKRILWQLANLSQVVFEVTDACNLRCKYCAFGALYNDYDERKNKVMDFEIARPTLDYLFKLWESDLNHSTKRNVTFGFYGGEPLMNMGLIRKIIRYIEKYSPKFINCNYNMTTNGILLNKYMDFLVEKDFKILISLDGNENNHSYRVKKSGENSFFEVCENIDLLYEKHPEFFLKNVNFNSVLHDRNSLQSIYSFVHSKYGKVPFISEVTGVGIAPSKLEEFNEIYKNSSRDLQQSDNYKLLSNELETSNPDFKRIIFFMNSSSGNIYKQYNELFGNKINCIKIPTATCFPFERKLFLTVNGKIMPCERISHQFILGSVKNNNVYINCKKIASKYNSYYNSIKKYCIHCYGYDTCTACIFNLMNTQGEFECRSFRDKKTNLLELSLLLSTLENSPEYFIKSYDITLE